MPAGFPKGQTAYTTAKVIVARAFAPASTTWRYARVPFDPEQSEHGTHVAGIAAGNAGTVANGTPISGVAARAYIGNYKALSVPTDADVGLDGNAAELVAAIEAAVADGMDVINLSLGEPEVEPTRDLVALALDGAARAGVIPVVAAGNDFEEFGKGSLSSPGSSALAITVAAVTIPDAKGNSSLAGFSSSGPTPLSLRLKPDVSAPGVSILSSLPNGQFSSWSGTSMASPQVAGAAALLRERHPSWPVALVKAALDRIGRRRSGRRPARTTDTRRWRHHQPRESGRPAHRCRRRLRFPSASWHPAEASRSSSTSPTPVRGQGSGTSLSSPSLRSSEPRSRSRRPSRCPALSRSPQPSTARAADGDFSGFIRLTRGPDVRRVPFWLHVSPARARRRDRCRSHRSRPPHREHERQALASGPLPVSRRALGRHRQFAAAGAGAGLPVRSDATRRELRCRRHAPRCRRESRAAGRLRGRREQADGLRRTSALPQPLSRAVR